MALRLSRRMELSIMFLVVTGFIVFAPPVTDGLKKLWGWARTPSMEVQKPTPKNFEPEKKKTVAMNLAQLNENLARGRVEVSPPPPPVVPASSTGPLVKEEVVKAPAPIATKASAPTAIAPKPTPASPTPPSANAVAVKVTKPVAKATVPATPRVHARKVTRKSEQVKVTATQNAGTPAPAGITASEATVPFTWTPSTDITCDPRAGCNLAWVLAQAKWPGGVKDELMKKVQGERPRTIYIGPGWHGWFVRKTHTHIIEHDAVARFGNLTIDALHWYAESEGTGYHLIRVSCLTWAGFISTPIPNSKREVVASELGVIPVAHCQ